MLTGQHLAKLDTKV